MPVIRIREGALAAPDRADLRDGILAEMRRPANTSRPVGAPVVVREEAVGMPRYSHWFVVWEEFRDIDSEYRASLIMDAIETEFGREEVLRTSSVMGLTPDEPLVRDLRLLPPPSPRQPAVVREQPAAYRTRQARRKA
jgi:hypothetical protein